MPQTNTKLISLLINYTQNNNLMMYILFYRVQKYFHFFGWFQSLERMRSHGRGGVHQGEVSETGRERIFLMVVGPSEEEKAEAPDLK